MTSLNREELRTLRDQAKPPCVSIFLPTERPAVEVPKNRIRLKNLLRQAEEQLSARGDGYDAALLSPARDLIDDASFWQQPGAGLALLLAPGLFRSYRLGERVQELAVVGDGFHLAPLLPALGADGHFHLLALSQKQVRLFAGSREGLQEIDLGNVPRSIQEALHYDVGEHALQLHSVPATPQTIGSRGRPGGGGQAVPTGHRQGMFHGHGTVEEDGKEQVHRFFQVLDDSLAKLWHLHTPPLPLVLAGVDYERAMFRELSKHPRLVDVGVDGSPDGLATEELKSRAWPVVEPILHEEERRAAAAFEEVAGTPRASGDLEEVMVAAADGRVETLFADARVQRWGRFDAATRTLEVHETRQPGDEELVNRAACEAAFHGGRVFPGRAGEGVLTLGPVAAVFRY